MITRQLTGTELPLIWTIDRREVIENIYRLRDGELVMEPHHFDVQGWAPERPNAETPKFQACFDRGGCFIGAFEEATLAGIAVVDCKRVGAAKDLVQLTFLHVGRDYRGQGLGARLFAEAARAANGFGAVGLYISATPSENTIRFYQRRGCTLTEPDAVLFQLEPEDIHFEWRPPERPVLHRP